MDVKKIKQFCSRWGWLLVLAVIAAATVPLLQLALCNHPSSDDYTFAIGVHDVILQYGFDLPRVLAAAWQGSMEYWHNWQGTYASCFLFALQPAIWGDKFYALTTPIMLGALALGFAWLGYAVQRLMGKKGPEWLYVSAVAWYVAVQGLPFAVDALYWYNGSVHYTFFTGLLLCGLGALIQSWCAASNRRGVFYALAALVAVLVCGGNTVTAWLELLIMVLATAWFLWNKRWGILLPAVTTVVCYCLNMLAPGTLFRASGMDKRYGLVEAVFVSLRTTAQCFADWATPALLLGLLMLTPALVRLVRGSGFSFRLPGVAVVFLYLLYSAMLCVPVYSMGDVGPYRLIDAEFVLLWVFVLAAYTYLLGWMVHQYEEKSALLQKLAARPLWEVPLCLLLAVAVLGFGKTEGKSVSMEAVAELKSGEAYLYDMGMSLRVQDYLNEELTDVECPALHNQPELLFHNDISGDPDEYHSRAIANYYHKNSVRRVYYGEY